MKTAYFDCFGGASGDMILGALLDADANLGALRVELAKMGVAGYALAAETVSRGGLRGLKFNVLIEDQAELNDSEDHTGHPHANEADHAAAAHHGKACQRRLSDIFALLDNAKYPQRVDMRVRKIFRRLAQAEANAHGTSVEEVHFHEVGAIDSIVDIVGAVLALEQLGIDQVICSPIPMGTGTVTCAHGVFPVPAPATAELMREGQIAPSDFPAELLHADRRGHSDNHLRILRPASRHEDRCDRVWGRRKG